jgi:hypothetical protein
MVFYTTHNGEIYVGDGLWSIQHNKLLCSSIFPLSKTTQNYASEILGIKFEHICEVEFVNK